MLPPVRCFTCGKPVGGEVREKYEELVTKGEEPGKALDSLGVRRYCCRSMLLTSEDYFDGIMKYTAIRGIQ